MRPEQAVFVRYQDLQRYVGWSADDERLVTTAGPLIGHRFDELVEDFYAELQRHPAASRVIVGGAAQITRLKQTLKNWLHELFAGPYDEEYVARRWRVGLKHVEIGLPQVYTAAALARLRNALIRMLRETWQSQPHELSQTLLALNKLLDLDLAVIGDAYETEHVQRQQELERHRLSDALHREKELSAGLLAHAHAAVLVLDRHADIVRANPIAVSFAATCIEGPPQGRNWIDIFLRPEDHERVRRLLVEQPAAERPVVATSTLRSDGRSRQLHWSAVPLLDAAGGRFAMLVIGHDVTDLFEAQQRALQAERLAAIGQMATGLAHESRNALQRIGASAEMLELELEGNEAALELVARIQQSNAHLHQLLEEVRGYAAPIILDRSPLPITEPWREAWELLFAQRRGRDVSLREHLRTRELVVEADRFRLVQVFRNLFDNGLAAASDPVIIDVTCESARLAENDAIRIRVRDNGPGLAPDVRRRLFEPFYTTKPTGTGLGTSIAQRLVEAHGGTIEVGHCSAPGTEIVLTLPVGDGVRQGR